MSKRRKKSAKNTQNPLVKFGIIGAVGLGLVALILAAGGGLPSAAPPVAQERLDLDPVLGNLDAPVTVIEYGAYSCQACQQLHRSGIIEDILAEYNGQVNFVFRDLPIITPNFDRMAANVAQCALDQGQDQFWAYHNALYTAADAPGDSQADLIELGGRAGLDVNALATCAEAGTHRLTVQYDENRGRDMSLRSTPSFVVNGQVIFGANPNALREAINAALAS